MYRPCLPYTLHLRKYVYEKDFFLSSAKCCSFDLLFIRDFFTLIIIIIINVSRAANRHILMISEESCDTEDLSNDAEYSAAHHRN